MIDTHAHLDALDDPAAAVARAREAGVTRIITIGTDPTSWATTLPIVEEHDGVYGVAGVHPHEAASEFDARALERPGVELRRSLMGMDARDAVNAVVLFDDRERRRP